MSVMRVMCSISTMYFVGEALLNTALGPTPSWRMGSLLVENVGVVLYMHVRDNWDQMAVLLHLAFLMHP